jgi:hypothetical protein
MALKSVRAPEQTRPDDKENLIGCKLSTAKLSFQTKLSGTILGAFYSTLEE